MKIYIYIVILGLMSFGFLLNKLTSGIITSDSLTILLIFWAIIGCIYYTPKEGHILFSAQNLQWVFLIFFLFFLSSLSSVFTYNQSLSGTIFAIRTDLLAPLFFFVFLKIRPSEDDFFKAFNILGILAILFLAIVIINPFFFVEKEMVNRLLIRQKKGSTDIAVLAPAFSCGVWFFYISLQILANKFTLKHFLIATICIVYIVLVQNRSTLFIAFPFYVFVLLKASTNYRWLIICIIVSFTAIFISTIFDSLWNETVSQLSDKKYNRWRALNYFLNWKNSFYNIMFGHGCPTNGSTYLRELVKAQEKNFSYISDIGLIGTYFYYGLSMLFVIYRFVFKAIFTHRIPLYLKLYALWILFVPTIHGFGLHGIGGAMNYAIFFYLVTYNLNKSNLSKYNHGSISNNSQLQHQISHKTMH